MNIRSMASGLLYRGEVVAVRQTYYIFEGKRHFFVLSFNKSKHNAGNFNYVDVKAVQYVNNLFAGKKGVTSKKVVKTTRKPRYIRAAMDALNILYILIALKEVTIDRRYKGRELKFNFRS